MKRPTVHTGKWKDSIHGRCRVGRLNLEGDGHERVTHKHVLLTATNSHTTVSARKPHDRALSRLQKLHIRLGGSGAVGDGLPPKPKGMHWKTYRVLADRFRRQDIAMDSAAAAYFGVVS